MVAIPNRLRVSWSPKYYDMIVKRIFLLKCKNCNKFRELRMMQCDKELLSVSVRVTLSHLHIPTELYRYATS